MPSENVGALVRPLVTDWYCVTNLLCFVGFAIPKPKLYSLGLFVATGQKAAQLKRPKVQPGHAGEFHRFTCMLPAVRTVPATLV